MKLLPEVKECLLVAKAILEHAWIQAAMAEDEYGNDADPIGNKGVTFCSLGAIRHAGYLLNQNGDYVNPQDAALVLGETIARTTWTGERNEDLEIYLSEYDYENEIIDLNDATGTTEQKVLAMFDKAMED